MAIHGVQTAKPNPKEMKIGAKYLRRMQELGELSIPDEDMLAVKQCASWFEQEAAKHSK